MNVAECMWYPKVTLVRTETLKRAKVHLILIFSYHGSAEISYIQIMTRLASLLLALIAKLVEVDIKLLSSNNHTNAK